eukprot:8758490-Alexandrium_andersonii.AAC.1
MDIVDEEEEEAEMEGHSLDEMRATKARIESYGLTEAAAQLQMKIARKEQEAARQEPRPKKLLDQADTYAKRCRAIVESHSAALGDLQKRAEEEREKLAAAQKEAERADKLLAAALSEYDKEQNGSQAAAAGKSLWQKLEADVQSEKFATDLIQKVAQSDVQPGQGGEGMKAFLAQVVSSVVGAMRK